VISGGCPVQAPIGREFMLKQTRETDLALFIEASKSPRPATPADIPMTVVIPAYVISEIKTGFQMGFFLFVPFILIWTAHIGMDRKSTVTNKPTNSRSTGIASTE